MQNYRTGKEVRVKRRLRLVGARGERSVGIWTTASIGALQQPHINSSWVIHEVD